MSDAERLREKLWERPDDRALLSVYGDALATEGHLTRAEFIQLSLLENPTAAQVKRAQALLNKHRSAWLGPARKFVWSWREDPEVPGFVRRVKTAMQRFNAGFEHIRKLGPRLVVVITAPKSNRDVRELGALPLGSIYGLEFYEDGSTKDFVNDFLFETIAPSVTGLRHLAVGAGHFSASREGLATLLSQLSGLERLKLSIDEGTLPSLDDVPFRRTLREFNLVLNGVLPRTDEARIRKLFPRAHVSFEPDFSDEMVGPH